MIIKVTTTTEIRIPVMMFEVRASPNTKVSTRIVVILALIVIGFFSLFSGILPFSLDIDQTFIATPIMFDVTKKAEK